MPSAYDFPGLYDYLTRFSGRDEVLERVARETSELPDAGMLSRADQGGLLTILALMVEAKVAIEVGTFTGYSSICIARGLAPGGSLMCCDVSEEYTALARDAWAAAGLDDRIELRIGPALETLQALPPEATFDLVFIDADKPNYVNYYEALFPRLRTGGAFLVDNTLWSGRVVDAAADDENTVAIRRFNDHLAADDRVDSFILPVSDGLTLVRKR